MRRYKEMKRVLSVLLTIAMAFTVLGACAAVNADEDFSLTMQIGSPVMMVKGTEKTIDDEGSAPVIVNERTLLPIRAVVEEMGGTVGWEADTRMAVLNYGDKEIRLVIDSKTAYLNGNATELDTAPAIINDRTMLPIRFIAESFDFTVDWDGDTQTITITKSDKTDEPDATSSATQTAETPSPETTPEATPEAGSKILVAYFSRAGENYSVGTIDKGNTSYIADYIAEQTGADVFEIVPVNPYPQGYEDTKTRATDERNSNARPEYVGEVENFEQYDVVFIGHPIWWGDMPMIVYTFLENHNFDGKTVCQFNTHEGSGNAGTASKIKSKLPNATVTDYLAVSGSAAQKNDAALKTTIDSWLKKLGYSE